MAPSSLGDATGGSADLALAPPDSLASSNINSNPQLPSHSLCQLGSGRPGVGPGQATRQKSGPMPAVLTLPRNILRGAPWSSSLIMARLLRAPVTPHVYPSAPALPSEKLYEEERSTDASIERFYPMRLGELVNERYQIAAKLGWGVRSTVWLAKDTKRWRWQPERYVTMKVSVWHHEQTCAEAVRAELEALRCVNAGSSWHPGSRYVRKLLDSFELPAPVGSHKCMVFEPLREPLSIFGLHFEDKKIPTDMLPLLVKPILQGLDFLHTECKLIHTDLKPDNIMMAFSTAEEQEMLRLHAIYELQTPLPQKHLEDRTVYLSHNNFGPLNHGIGRPVIVDLDLAMKGNVEEPYSHEIQANGLQAPEVVIGAPWSYSADMWNLGVLLLHLMEGHDVFQSPQRTTDFARMVACLGPPPEELLRRRKRPTELYGADGKMKHLDTHEGLSLEGFVTRVEGEEQKLFLNFVRRMLRWIPEERASAKQLLDDPWLDADRYDWA